jgi:hypothetical protein
VALALLNAQDHALAVDIADLQRNDFAGAQSGAIGHRQRCLVLHVPGRFDQARHLLAAQDDRQLVRHLHRGHLGHPFGVADRELEEELQCGDRRVERDRRDTLNNQVQLVAAQILVAGRVGRATQKCGQPPHGTDVCVLGLGRELAHPHVLDHALTQRTDGLR